MPFRLELCLTPGTPLLVTVMRSVRSLNGLTGDVAGGWLDKHQCDELLSPGAPGAY